MKEELNVSKLNGHLIEGVKPIIACIGSLDDFKKSEILIEHHQGHISNNFLLNNLKNIDWKRGIYGSEDRDCLTAGPTTYVISAIDESNKFSEGFGACTGLIVAGIDKRTKKNISFVTHQPPFVNSGNFVNSSGKRLIYFEDFANDLEKRFLEMKERCEPNTIDVAIVGGTGSVLKEMYVKTIQLLSDKTQQILGFKPIVVNDPKTINFKFDNIYYDNNHRRLYFIRPGVDPDTGSFVPSDADNEKGKWG